MKPALTKKYRVLIADDHHLFRKGLAITLRLINSVSEVTEVSNGEEVLIYLAQEEFLPDIIFMDYNMKPTNGLETTRSVKLHYPEIKIIALSMYEDARHILDMFEAGASGYLFKNTVRAEIIEAMNVVMSGEKFYGKDISNDIVNNAIEVKRSDLLPNELKLIQLIYEEKSSREIAEILNISPRTLERHRILLFEKTNTQSIAGLIKFAMKNNLVRD